MLAGKAEPKGHEAPPELPVQEEGGGTVAGWRFRLIVLRYDRLVYRFASALLRDEREAEDVTQEAFLRYWQQGSAVRQPSSTST